MTLFPVLAIETSSRSGSVALMRDADTLDERALGQGAFQGKTLAPTIEALLLEGGVKPAEVGLVAVGLGPGSFTGLRVGIAFARGFAFAADHPMVGVSSMEALAHIEAEEGEKLLCVARAGHEELFHAAFEKTNGSIVSLMDPSVDSLDVVRDKMESFDRVLGEGTDLLGLEKASVVPSAKGVAVLGAKKFVDQGPTPEEELLPQYLRRSNAEINWDRRQNR